MDVGQVALVGLLGTLVGAVIAGVVTRDVTKINNEHAIRMAADERAHQDHVRKRATGIESAKSALGHLNRVRSVFDGFMEDGEPEQEWYEPGYRDAVLAAVDIDNDDVAKTLTDIAEVYWAAWLATEEGDWTARSLSYQLYKLAHATVRAYSLDQPLPDRSELDAMLRAIKYADERRRENEAKWRAELKAEREAARSAAAEGTVPSKPVRRRRSTARPATQ